MTSLTLTGNMLEVSRLLMLQGLAIATYSWGMTIERRDENVNDLETSLEDGTYVVLCPDPLLFETYFAIEEFLLPGMMI